MPASPWDAHMPIGRYSTTEPLPRTVNPVNPRAAPGPSRAARIARLIRVMRLIRCTIDPLIDHITRINHINCQIFE